MSDDPVAGRPASAVPLGLAGLAVASLVSSAYDLGWIAPGKSHQVALAVLVSVVPLQALATGVALLIGDGIAALQSALLAVVWAAEGVLTLAHPPGATSDVLGIVLLGAAIVIWLADAVGRRAHLATAIVVGGAALRFAFAGLHQLTAWGWSADAGGVAGLTVALGAAVVAVGLTEGGQ